MEFWVSNGCLKLDHATWDMRLLTLNFFHHPMDGVCAMNTTSGPELESYGGLEACRIEVHEDLGKLWISEVGLCFVQYFCNMSLLTLNFFHHPMHQFHWTKTAPGPALESYGGLETYRIEFHRDLGKLWISEICAHHHGSALFALEQFSQNNFPFIMKTNFIEP